MKTVFEKIIEKLEEQKSGLTGQSRERKRKGGTNKRKNGKGWTLKRNTEFRLII